MPAMEAGNGQTICDADGCVRSVFDLLGAKWVEGGNATPARGRD